MSRSNPTDGVRNPSTRWFTWAGGGDQGYVEWYDKDAKQNVKVDGAFTFLLLDQLATVKGWHDPSQSGIYANEVKDTRQDVLVVRAFKGGELCSGIYKDIKDSIVAKGGHFSASLYLAYKDGEELKIGNLQLKGSALSAWSEFKKGAGKKINTDAVTITGFIDEKKGGTKFRTPVFSLKPVGEATNQQAVALDAELQAFFGDYLKRPKAEAAKPTPNGDHDEPPLPDEAPKGAFEDFESDIPF
jgi:hypothetical protein